jgi:hypothetical protein
VPPDRTNFHQAILQEDLLPYLHIFPRENDLPRWAEHFFGDRRRVSIGTDCQHDQHRETGNQNQDNRLSLPWGENFRMLLLYTHRFISFLYLIFEVQLAFVWRGKFVFGDAFYSSDVGGKNALGALFTVRQRRLTRKNYTIYT